jgi:hypothetical protein
VMYAGHVHQEKYGMAKQPRWCGKPVGRSRSFNK